MSKSRLFPSMWFWLTLSACLLAYLFWFFWPAWYIPATGGIAVVVTRVVGDRRKLRKTMNAARVQLEPQLDALIALAERAGGSAATLEELVRFNETRVHKDVSHRDIEIRDGKLIYYLAVEKVLTGSEPYAVNIEFTICGPNDAVQVIHWPDRYFRRPAEPWLKERLDKLSSLIGTASAYETRRKKFADRGITIARRT